VPSAAAAFEPAGTAFLTAGIQGLAPYWFEIALLGFLSDRGQPGARLEVETDFFLTQRLIARPTARIDWSAGRDARRRVDAGFSTGKVGMRTRYEIRRKFAPYVDVRRVWESGPDQPEHWRVDVGLWLIG
jgi:copper resistance protein B